MKAVYALLYDGHAGQQAVNRLRAAGLKAPGITVLSGRPMEFEFGHMDKATWMWWIACGGALVGMAVASVAQCQQALSVTPDAQIKTV